MQGFSKQCVITIKRLVGRGHVPAGAGTTSCEQTCSSVPSAASRSAGTCPRPTGAVSFMVMRFSHVDRELRNETWQSHAGSAYRVETRSPCRLPMQTLKNMSVPRNFLCFAAHAFPPCIAGLPDHIAAGSMLLSCNCSLSAMSAINSEFVGFPLVFDTV